MGQHLSLYYPTGHLDSGCSFLTALGLAGYPQQIFSAEILQVAYRGGAVGKGGRCGAGIIKILMDTEQGFLAVSGL